MTAQGGDDLMGWIEKIKDIIGGLRASGKNEKEIEDIVQQAADKATVAGVFRVPEKLLTAPEYEQQYQIFAKAAGEAMKRLKEKINEAGMTAGQVAATIRKMYSVRQQESNNWRKMHGLPMRRKGKRRR